MDPTPESQVKSQTSWFSADHENLSMVRLCLVVLRGGTELRTAKERDFSAHRPGVGLFVQIDFQRPGLAQLVSADSRCPAPKRLARGDRLGIAGRGVSLAAAALLASLCWIAWRLGNKLWRLSGAPLASICTGRKSRWNSIAAWRPCWPSAAWSAAAGQTQREFANSAGPALAAVSGETGLELMPLCVAEAFYRVRFGRLPLDNDQAQAVEQALDRIAACEAAAG